MTKRVLVLMGGFSQERAISLQSGKSCVAALRASGRYIVDWFDFSTDMSALLEKISHQAYDVVFNATHGTFGEDGGLQHMLDGLGVAYTHSSAAASYLAFHKHLTAVWLKKNGLVTPSHEVVAGSQLKEKTANICSDVVVKPTSEGSSIDVYMLKSKKAREIFEETPGDHFEKTPLWLIEEYIKGRELTVGVLEGKALEVTEIRYQSDFYDYDAKYTPASLAQHICPAPLTDAEIREVKHIAEEAHKVLGCAGISRVDIRFDEKKDFVILEVNTQPGMTDVSLVPEQARVAGLKQSDLVVRLVEASQT